MPLHTVGQPADATIKPATYASGPGAAHAAAASPAGVQHAAGRGAVAGPRRADARRQLAPEPRHLLHDLDGAGGPAADGRLDRQEHDRQGRVPADRRDRVALRAHPGRPVARPRRRPRPIGCSTTGSSEAAMLGGLALKWRWRQAAPGRRPARRSAQPGLRPGAGLLGEVRPLLRRRAARDPARGRRHAACARTSWPPTATRTPSASSPTLGITFTGAYEPVAEHRGGARRAAAGHRPRHPDPRRRAPAAGSSRRSSSPSCEWDFRLPRVKSINTSGPQVRPGAARRRLGHLARRATSCPRS